MITAPVVRLRSELGLPGMVVLQFQLGGGARNPHRPENHPQQAVVYTGTHDNDTTLGWWESLTDRQRTATGLDPPTRVVADRARRGTRARRSRSRRCRTCLRLGHDGADEPARLGRRHELEVALSRQAR